MGYQIHYQALPPDCPMLVRARYDAKFGEWLQFLTPGGSLDEMLPLPTDAVEREFAEQARLFVENHPDFATRYVFAGRASLVIELHFLITGKRQSDWDDGETRYDWETYPDPDWRTLYGGDIINIDLRATQGIPLHYLSPEETAQAAHRWSTVAIPDNAFYTSQVFKDLTMMYREAAKRAEGVLVIMD